MITNNKKRVLFVSGGNNDKLLDYVKEQADEINDSTEYSIDHYLIKGKGIIGYLKNYIPLRRKLISNNYDFIHAHYGLSGMLAVLQRKCRVIITFHGSDLNRKDHRKISILASYLATKSIVVSEKLKSHLASNKNNNIHLIPCGVDLSVFKPIHQNEAKLRLNLNQNDNYILFGGAKSNKVKNWNLALKALENIRYNYKIIELKNMSREQVNLALNSSSILLLTSHMEGSPQIIKEAMSTNTPIVVTNVGDVEWLLHNVTNTYIVKHDKNEISNAINNILSHPTRLSTNGRERILELKLDKESVTKELRFVYHSIE
ncbi:MAG: glycosyltransferase family 4 protein [Candidatus Thiodiazotropha sp. DIVDIV]